MMESVVCNQARPWRRGFAANQNQAAYAAKIARLARPTGTGVVDFANEGILVPSALKLAAVGVGASNDAYSLRVWGWAKFLGGGDHPNGGTSANTWVPFLIAELLFTLGLQPGIAGGVFPGTELIADTVTIVSGGEGTTTANTTRDGNIVTYSPVNDLFAFAVVPLMGFEVIEFDTKQTTNTPTANILYAPL